MLAILRKCTEFADVIGGLANELEQQSPQQRQLLAQAIQSDVDNYHTLQLAVVEEQQNQRNQQNIQPTFRRVTIH